MTIPLCDPYYDGPFATRPRNGYFAAAVLVTLAAVPASAKDLTITLTDAEQQSYVQALDAYVKAGGINVATPAVVLLQKLQQAAQVPDAAPPTGGTK